MTTVTADVGVGPLLRSWRERRRLSQLDLALEAGAHLLDPLHRQVVLTGDPALTSLYDELAAYPGPVHDAGASHGPGIVVPLRLRAGERELAFFSTVATFGTAIDITVAELSIESFFPADGRARVRPGGSTTSEAPGAGAAARSSRAPRAGRTRPCP